MELVPIPAVLSAPYAGVQLSEEAARAPGRGLQSAGRSIMEVGDQVQELGQRVQAAKNTVDLVKAQQEMKAARQRFNEWALTNPDESQWEKRSKEEVAKARQNIAGLKLSRDAQQRLTPDLMAFEQDFPTEVRFAATDKQVKGYRATTYKAAEDDADSGDLNAAFMKIENGVKAGFIDEREGKMKQKQLSQQATRAYLLKTINEDPQTAQEMLDAKREDGQWANFGKQLSEADRLTLSRSAITATATLHEQTAQGFAEQIYKGDRLGLAEQIDAAVADRKILPSQAFNLKRTMLNQWNPEEVTARGAVLVDAARSLDPSDPQKFDDAAIYIRAQAATLPEGVREYVFSSIERRRTSGLSRAELKPQIDAADYLKDFMEHDGFGRYSDTDKTPFEVEMVRKGWFNSTRVAKMKRGKPVLVTDQRGEPKIDKAQQAKNLAAREAALSRYWAASEALTNFRKQHPEADEAEAVAFVKKYTEGDRKKAAFGGPPINPATTP